MEITYSEKILELLQGKQYNALQKYLDTLNPADIAECMTDLLDDGELEACCVCSACCPKSWPPTPLRRWTPICRKS